MTGLKTPQTLRLGTWNMLKDRPDRDILPAMREIMEDHRLHALLLLETRDYLDVLSRPSAVPGYTLLNQTIRPKGTAPPPPGSDQLSWLVRSDVKYAHPRIIDLGGDGWTTVDGAHHVGSLGLGITLAGWLRILGIHLPPGLEWSRGQLVGPQERTDDYAANARRLVAYSHERRRTAPDKGFIIVGDWNCNAKTDRGKFSSTWIADEADLHLPRNAVAIDYPMAEIRNTRLTELERHERFGSDHALVTFKASHQYTRSPAHTGDWTPPPADTPEADAQSA